MRILRLHWLLAALALAPLSGGAELAPELADIAARLSYGYYTENRAVVGAAREALRRMPASPAGRYYGALGALRAAQLGAGQARGRLLEECIAMAELAAEHREHAAEAQIIVAACSTLVAAEEPLKGVLHQRRREQALRRAQEIDPGNPRALWVATWGGERAKAPLDAVARAALEETVAAFGSYFAGFDAPDWGEAEALAELGAAFLASDDIRRARDVLEQALLVAPDYGRALRLLAELRTRR